MSYFPTRLPLGMAESDTFVDSIIELLGPGLEKVPKDDIRFVIATNITHLGPKAFKVSKNHFVQVIRTAAAKQIAGQMFQDVKKRQQEELKKQAEAAALNLEAADNAKQEEKTT